MKNIFIFLLMFLCTSAFGQLQTEQELLAKAEAASGDTDKLKVYIDLHNLVFKSNIDKSEEYAGLILKHGKASNNLRWENKGYLGLARCYRKRRQYNYVIKYDSLSLLCSQRSGNAKDIFSAKMELARDFLDGDIPSKAFPFLKECETLSEKSQDQPQIAKTQQTLGWYYFKQHQNTKSIPHYRRAIAAFLKLNNEYMTAQSKILLVQALLPIGLTDDIPDLLFDALQFFKKNNNQSMEADCYSLLGESYLINGNASKGIENYLEAKRLRNVSNNKVEEALATIDLARAYLAGKDLKKAESLAKEAEKVFAEMKYDFGLIMIKTFWGEYYSQKNNYSSAEQYFAQADKQAKELQFPDLQTDNERYWTKSKYRQKNFKAADSLMISYAQKVATQREPAIIVNELNTLSLKNRSLDSNKIRLMKLLYTPQESDELKKNLKGKSLSSVVGMDSLFMVNPFSLASASYDSAANIAYNKQLLDMETKYKTRLVSDSLHREQQNSIITKQKIRTNNIVIFSAAAISLLLLAGFTLQYRSRQRAEKDSQKIQLLQNEIHHRVKNNLGVIQRLVDVAGKNAVDDVPLSSLKTRIKSIELLHTHLYNDKAKPGNISLQAYLEDLCLAIAAAFNNEKNIKIQVNAAEELDSHIAEKLGLIVNELVTNSYKYAFEGKNEGLINITAQKDEKTIKIAVEDNGVGFAAEKTKSSYGMKLIKGLSHELNGKYFFSNSGGTKFQLQIPT